mgnify:CR=1 FL=1
MFARVSGIVLLVLGCAAIGLFWWAYIPGDPEAVWKPAWLHYSSLVFLLLWLTFSATVVALLIFERTWPLFYWLGILMFILAAAACFLTYRAEGVSFTLAEPEITISLLMTTVLLWTGAGYVAAIKSSEFFLPSKLR